MNKKNKEVVFCFICGKKPVKIKNVCQNCYQKIYFGYLQPPEKIKNLFSKFKKCLVLDCRLNSITGGYCRAHYEDLEMNRPFRRIKSRSSTKVEKQTNKGKICRFESCDRQATSCGYCPAHYNQWLKKKKVEPLRKKKKNRQK